MARRKTMLELREIIHRLRLGQSIRAIQRETGTHRSIVRQMNDMARLRGWLDAEKTMPEDSEIKKAHEEVNGKVERKHQLDAYKDDIKRWVNEGFSYTVMHKMLEGRYEGAESTVRRYVHRKFSKTPKPVPTSLRMECCSRSAGFHFSRKRQMSEKAGRAILFSAAR